MKQAMALLAGAAAVLAANASAAQNPAPPLLSPVFTDHAVVQRDKPILVWGWTAPRAHVSVSLADRTAKAKADATGRWSATFAAMPTTFAPTHSANRMASNAATRTPSLMLSWRRSLKPE